MADRPTSKARETQPKEDDWGVISSAFLETERFFHYTSADGLLGILNSNCFWATHYQFLNDRREIRAAERVFQTHLAKGIHRRVAAMKVNGELALQPGASLREAVKEEAEAIVQSHYGATLSFMAPYITSFFLCDEMKNPTHFRDGILRHWATYGRAGGFAIQISPKKLYDALIASNRDQSHSGILQTRVIYPENEDRINDELGDAFDTLLDVGVRLMEERLRDEKIDDSLGKAIEDSYLPFCRVISSIKLPYFADESEARVAIFRPTVSSARKAGKKKPPHMVHLRSGLGSPVPYIKLLENFVLSSGCIERIIVGPSSENAMNKIALESFLEARELDIDVTLSDVPYLTTR